MSSEDASFRMFVSKLKSTIVLADARNRHRMYEALQHGTVPVVMFHEVTAFCLSLAQSCPASPYCQTPLPCSSKDFNSQPQQSLALTTRKYN